MVACAAVAAALGGCGLGSGPAATNTQLLVSKDFGSQPIVDSDSPKVGGSDTVMRLLQRNAPKVTTKYGGNFVQSIDGVSGGQSSAGKPVDWFFYINGIEASKGATAVRVHQGDRVWWDWHDWGVTDDVPAVVGSYPEPFLHGVDGHRLVGIPAFKRARLGQVRTFQLTKALGLLTVLENMKLGAPKQVGEGFWAGLLPFLWRGQETANEAKARDLLTRFAEDTGSEVAAELLADWGSAVPRFTRVMPSDYKRVLEAREEAREEGLDEDETAARIMEVLHG